MRSHLPGVGLGLALVQQLVTALGGEIALESEVGRGSAFKVVLPSRAPPGEARPIALPVPAPSRDVIARASRLSCGA